MKKLALIAPIFAAFALFAQPALADAAHRHEKCAHAAHAKTAEPANKMNDHEGMMQESVETMRAQMEKINQTKSLKKRQKLLQEHSQSLLGSIKMMREMMGGMAMNMPMTGGHKQCDHKMGGKMMGGQMMGSQMMGSQMMGGHKMCDQMMGDHKMGGQMMGGQMMGGQMMGGHKMDGNPVSTPAGNADAASAVQVGSGQMASADKTSANPEKKLWVCPMHPGVVRDQPGICPICGMDLVEMGQSGASQAGHSHTMGDGMMGNCVMGGGMKCQMMEMADERMGMMLILMEQMIEHVEAEMAVRK